MNEQLKPYFGDFSPSGKLDEDVTAVLTQHHFPKVAGHVSRVAQEARRLARQFGANPTNAETAAWLHDISAVIPNPVRVALCRSCHVHVMPGEAAFPMILHQKLSVVVAQEIFGLTDTAVLCAIGCHTTLKAGATQLDKIVFLADKIKWDQPGTPPYLAELQTAVAHSLDDACRVYLNYLWQQRYSLRLVHPWFLEAYKELVQQKGGL